jgi:hypothetical protein
MEIIKEITQWDTDLSRQPNHTYLVNNKGQIIAYAKHHSNDVNILNSRIILNKRYRKFIKDNHFELSLLIPIYIHEDNKSDNDKLIIPDNSRVFKVKSKDKQYTIILNNNQYNCNCTGFGFRRKCKHVDAVVKKQQLLTGGLTIAAKPVRMEA